MGPTPILSALKTILSEPHPVKQLWRGTLPSVIRTSFGSGLYFASLERMRRALAQLQDPGGQGASASRTSALPKLGMTANLATGALARASVGFVIMPVTVLKVRFESNIYTSSPSSLPKTPLAVVVNNPYNSLVGATRSIHRTEGIRGFFKGAGATAVRDAPYAGIYLGFYEGAKSFISTLLLPSNTLGSSSSSAAVVNFTSGALAAALATTVTNPPDVVKTRLQLMPEKYQTTLQAVRVMVQEEGLRCLWGGLGLRVSRKALSSALAWTVYEEAVRRAGDIWGKPGDR